MVPPFTAVAVNVEATPEQPWLPVELVIVTAGTTNGLTVMVILLLVAVALVGQGTLVVSTQVITSPLTSDDTVYVVLLVPTFTPFFFH